MLCCVDPFCNCQLKPWSCKDFKTINLKLKKGYIVWCNHFYLTGLQKTQIYPKICFSRRRHLQPVFDFLVISPLGFVNIPFDSPLAFNHLTLVTYQHDDDISRSIYVLIRNIQTLFIFCFQEKQRRKEKKQLHREIALFNVTVWEGFLYYLA